MKFNEITQTYTIDLPHEHAMAVWDAITFYMRDADRETPPTDFRTAGLTDQEWEARWDACCAMGEQFCDEFLNNYDTLTDLDLAIAQKVLASVDANRLDLPPKDYRALRSLLAERITALESEAQS